jgi:hypothetical protein
MSGWGVKKMGGFLGIGGSSAKTDRGNQLAATSGDWSLFNYGLGQGQAGQATGQTDLSTALSTLGAPQQYFQNLLTAGRTQTQENAAPAIDQVLANATATRNAEGTFGTSRTGGTVAANRNASANTQSQIDQIINTNLQTGRAQGAQGLEAVSGAQASIGGTELQNSLAALGLSEQAVNQILGNATQSKQNDPNVGNAIGSAVGQLYLNAIMGAAA